MPGGMTSYTTRTLDCPHTYPTVPCFALELLADQGRIARPAGGFWAGMDPVQMRLGPERRGDGRGGAGRGAGIVSEGRLLLGAQPHSTDF